MAIVNDPTQARTDPDAGATPIELVEETRPLSGGPTILPVLEHATSADGGAWLRVLLPGRPNSHGGWISAASTTPVESEWRITIDTSARRVTVRRNDHVTRTFKAVVGKPSTPTPGGSFFVEEVVSLGRGAVGAPVALALSARSNVLQSFAGGPGQIAIHGTRNVGGRPGTAVSHGCVRLPTRKVSWLSDRIGPGTSVTIRR